MVIFVLESMVGLLIHFLNLLTIGYYQKRHGTMRFYLPKRTIVQSRQCSRHILTYQRQILSAMPSEWRSRVRERWLILMQDFFSLAWLQVHHARSTARLSAYPASSRARLKALNFARALGYAVVEAETARSSAGLPPPVSAAQSYQTKDLERSRCSHKREDGTAATKQYHAAKSNWMRCHLCERRWKLVADDELQPWTGRWVVSDKDAPNSQGAGRWSSGKPSASQPSSSRSVPSLLHQAPRASTRCRPTSSTTSRPQVVPVPMSESESISSRSSWTNVSAEEEDREL